MAGRANVLSIIRDRHPDLSIKKGPENIRAFSFREVRRYSGGEDKAQFKSVRMVGKMSVPNVVTPFSVVM